MLLRETPCKLPMKKILGYLKSNKLIVFFWIYVVYGCFIYATNLGRILKYWNDDFLEEATTIWIDFGFLHYYNVITNLILLIGLLFLGLLLRGRNQWFINSFLVHTFVLMLINYFNEYKIDQVDTIPASIISTLKNTVTGTTVLIWLVIWGIYFGKREKPKLIFSNREIIRSKKH